MILVMRAHDDRHSASRRRIGWRPIAIAVLGVLGLLCGTCGFLVSRINLGDLGASWAFLTTGPEADGYAARQRTACSTTAPASWHVPLPVASCRLRGRHGTTFRAAVEDGPAGLRRGAQVVPAIGAEALAVAAVPHEAAAGAEGEP